MHIDKQLRLHPFSLSSFLSCKNQGEVDPGNDK